MKQIMPVKIFVIKGMNLAEPCDRVERKKAIRSFHNKLAKQEHSAVCSHKNRERTFCGLRGLGDMAFKSR